MLLQPTKTPHFQIFSQNLAHIEPAKRERHSFWSYKTSEEKYETFVEVILSKI